MLNPAIDTELAGAPRQLAYTAVQPADCRTPAPARSSTTPAGSERIITPGAAPDRSGTTQLAPADRTITTQPAPADRTITTLPSTGQVDARATSRGTGAQIGLGGATLLLLATIGVMSARKRRS